MYRGTKQVAELLGVKVNRLTMAMWTDRILPMPRKGPGNSYVWTKADINRASRALLGKPFREVKNGS